MVVLNLGCFYKSLKVLRFDNMAEKRDVHIELSLKEGSAGNMLVIVKFDPNASNYSGSNHTWCPTLAEARILEKALRVYG